MSNRFFLHKRSFDFSSLRDYLPSGWGGRAHDEAIWPVVRKKVITAILFFLLFFLLLLVAWLND